MQSLQVNQPGWRWVLPALFALLLAACGGDSEKMLTGGSAGSGGSGGGGSDAVSEEDAALFTLSLALVDVTGEPVGTSARPLNDGRSGRARVQLESDQNVDLSNRVVSFSTDSGLGELKPATALTDDNGAAAVTLEAGASAGADILRASVQVDDETLSVSIGFQTSGSDGDSGGGESDVGVLIGHGSGVDFEEGVVAVTNTTPSAGSSIGVTVNLVEETDNGLWNNNATVSFHSNCVANETAILDPVDVPNIGGTAITSYTPSGGCVIDQISATVTVNGELLFAQSAQLDIQSNQAESVEFLGAEPSVIGLKGAGDLGRSETSVLRFQVKDGNGDPVSAGEMVNFHIATGLGGFAISSDASSPTNSQGIVSVTVRSGTVPFVGSVVAVLDSNTDIKATGQVSVNSGAITQDRFSIALEELNPMAWQHLGKQVSVTVRAADRFGNTAPDGTVINFSAKLGDIEGSCATVDGTCSVLWSSQGPQLIHYDEDRAERDCFEGGSVAQNRHGLAMHLGCGEADRFGRNTIVAWTVGEESFSDANGNNIFDLGESWVALPEAFRDDNENGLRDGHEGFNEEFMDYDQDGSYSEAGDFFRGLGCSEQAAQSGHCQGLANVRASALMVLATDEVKLYVYSEKPESLTWDPGERDGQAEPVVALSPVNQLTAGNGTLYVLVADLNGNAAALGTQVDFDAGDLDTVGSTSCTIQNRTDARVCEFHYRMPSGEAPDSFASVVITATTPADYELQRVIDVVNEEEE